MIKRQKGMTLIELVVVMVIIAILAAIAVPSYTQYIIRGNRRAAQAAMMEIATQQHHFFAANRAYAGSVGALGYAPPAEVSSNYGVAVVADAGPPPGFTITFTPSGRQASDGVLTLTSAGVKTPADKW